MECPFCHIESENISPRVIKLGQFSYSIVSSPWIRSGHCLVIPRRHITNIAELIDPEAIEIYRELGRIGSLVDAGFGNEVRQKYAPMTPDGEIKHSHLHFHVIPRNRGDGVFIQLPENSSTDFIKPSIDEIKACLATTQP